jgi:deoxyribose-phosphate aldolase
MKFDPYSYTPEQIRLRISAILSGESALPENRDAYCTILSLVDLTSLEGTDTNARIISICEKAKSFHLAGENIPDVAAVCFYPPFIRLAKHELKNTRIRVASVAGAFPSGQSPLAAKLEEVKFALNEGADEIDTVISRGKFLEGDHAFIYDEIAAIKEACGTVHLKVILETGELQDVEHIRTASRIAIEAGADFIKTSTGKIQPAATEEAFFIMAETIKEYADKTGKKIGIKPAGGIASPGQALNYLNILHAILGPEWVNKDFFRIGASRLTDNLLMKIKS